jgi:hypothetical protein
MSEPSEVGWWRRRTNLTALLTVLAVCAWGLASYGAVELWTAPNAHFSDGAEGAIPEYENPLAGNEYVRGFRVLEWRDADRIAAGDYDDWVDTGPGTPGGDAIQVWLESAGMSLSTTTTVPSEIVGIHLICDSNDGLANIYVDGFLVARLDMGVAPYQRGLVIVEGLSNALHTIEVRDMGAGAGGGADVAILGASVLEAKWYQPPDPMSVEDVFLGWNEYSVWDQQSEGPSVVVADDWFCENPDPITDVHWWGSYIGLPGADLAGVQRPDHFHITIWTDVADPDPGDPTTFSHPGVVIHEVIRPMADITETIVGWDYMPQTGEYEAMFKYDLILDPSEYFYQEAGGNIYWISIAACYEPTPIVDIAYPWGWKTRPRDPASLAPDDAVRIFEPWWPVLGTSWVDGEPIEWPEGESWDMAFELTARPATEVIKWEQRPELIPNPFPPPDECYYGWDEWSVAGSPQIVLDDWLCTTDAPVSDIHWWGSYQDWVDEFPPDLPPDQLPNGFVISLWTDVPVGADPFSHPGDKIWEWWVPVEEAQEAWDGIYDCYDPAGVWESTFYYSWDIPVDQWFYQQLGCNIYWISVAATYPVLPCKCNADFNGDGVVDLTDQGIFAACLTQPPPPVGQCAWADLDCDGTLGPIDTAIFACQYAATWPDPLCCTQQGVQQAEFVWGWKTRLHVDPPPDDAVRMWPPYDSVWDDGEPIETFEGSWDTAFMITSKDIGDVYVKWSQPPVSYAPDDGYNGWNELSWYEGPQIAADDWVCETEHPVTDVHWWGSYIGWPHRDPPASDIPQAFHIAIWTDVPADVDQPFSHPGEVRWEYLCTDYRWEFVGWDWDPRDPTAHPEACYYFECDIPQSEWFFQEEACNIYWTSISAVYPLVDITWPWGWKTRPRNVDSLAPDDAVRILDPTIPALGSLYVSGNPLEFPAGLSWDLAFIMTTGPATQPEACCLPITATPPLCIDVPAADCVNIYGGTPQGPGINCSGVTEACCLPDDTCVDVDPLCCDDLGGVAQGGGSSCSGMEACCDATGACYMADATCCLANGDSPQGAGSNCTAVEACCFADNTCRMLDPLCCVDQGGSPQGSGSTCGGMQACCDATTGACYMADETCCLANGDSPQGAGTNCTAVEACCFADDTCQALDPLCCVDLGGTPQGAGSTCGGMEACCDPAGVCYMADRTCCLANGDSPQGPGSACTATEACCFPNGTCTDLDPLCCTDQGGMPQGPGTSCSITTAACCLPDGSCQDLDPLCCDELGGFVSPISNVCLGDGDGNGIDDACDLPTVACCLPDGSCADMPYDQCVGLGGDPQGPGTDCTTAVCHPIKYAQPPTFSPDSPNQDCFWGWDESSVYGDAQIVADDFPCESDDPISDIHWWGSYTDWDGEEPPPVVPNRFHIGIWTDVPAGVDLPFSHPGVMLQEWIVDYGALFETPFGCDFHPEFMSSPDTCFKYHFQIPREQWFFQEPDVCNIYWISIAAQYDVCACDADVDDNGTVDSADQLALQACFGSPTPPGCERADINCDGNVDVQDEAAWLCRFGGGTAEECCGVAQPEFEWGWKTREHVFMDDAIRIFLPTAPVPGVNFFEGFPIETLDGLSWDMAFVLTTVGELEPKWAQPPANPEQEFDAASDLGWPMGIKWEQLPDAALSGLHAHDYDIGNGYEAIILAEDWYCEGGVVTDFHWWGAIEDPGAGQDSFFLSMHDNEPSNCVPFDPPFWSAYIPMADITVTHTGVFNTLGYEILRYDYELPEAEWFNQEQGQQYWFNVIAVSNDPLQPFVWLWQEHSRGPAILCPAAQYLIPAQPFWWPIEWGPLEWSNMAFRVTSRPEEEVNKVMADDFISDGRVIEGVRWWGSYFDERYAPGPVINPVRQLDGWLITFHWADVNAAPACPPDVALDPPPTALGVYFAPKDAVTIVATGMVDCLGHPTYEYQVNLDRCCLLCSEPDPRAIKLPAKPEMFEEIGGYRYWLSIQAVAGVQWLQPLCELDLTGHLPSDQTPDQHFWGWHTSIDVPPIPGWLLDDACTGAIADFTPYPPDCWDYSQWDVPLYECPQVSDPPEVNMAFELLTYEVGARCVVDGDCDDQSVCTTDRCINGTCTFAPRVYGDVIPDNALSLFDIFCILNLIGGSNTDPACTFEGADIAGNGPGQCGPNGVLSLFDVFAVLDAIGGIDPCCSPQVLGACCTSGVCTDVSEANCFYGGGNWQGEGTDCSTTTCPAPPAPAAAAERALSSRRTETDPKVVLQLAPSTRSVKPGEVVAVDVLVSGVADFRGYEVALAATGGRSGSLDIESVIVDRDRHDYVFGSHEAVDVGDVAGSRVVAAKIAGGVDAREAYLATFMFRASEDALGTFRIVVREGGDTMLLNSVGSTLNVRSITNASIRVR